MNEFNDDLLRERQISTARTSRKKRAMQQMQVLRRKGWI